MFEDLDDELELDLLAQPKSDDDVEDQQQEKLQKKMGLGEVCTLIYLKLIVCYSSPLIFR